MQPSPPTVAPICLCTLLDMHLASPIISEIASSEILVLPVMLCTLITLIFSLLLMLGCNKL